jgi:hypothetical protein
MRTFSVTSMKNPVNRLATAAPRALDSILSTSKDSHHEMKQKKERSCSFDLDLSGLHLDARSRSGIGASSSVGASSGGLSGGSITEEGSIVTFEDLSEFTNELNLDWKMDTTKLPAPPSPN